MAIARQKMNRPLTFSEKTRILDGFTVARWLDRSIPICKKDALALSDYRLEIARHARGEPIVIPPPWKWPDSGPRRWSKAEITAAKRDPKRAKEYLAVLYAARLQCVNEAIAAGRGAGAGRRSRNRSG